jgi:single-stranded DNA-binding protein
MKTYKYEHMLFGSHLLNRYPQAVVNIVESEKTALICANAYGHPEQNLWLACGGLQFFRLEHIKPLLDAKRRIWLWPDKDGVSQWEAKMKDILSDRVTMTTRFIEDNWTPEDGEKADVADIILRHIQQPSTAVDRRNNHTGDGQGATDNNATASYHSGATPAPTPDTDRPADVLPEEWREHKVIMQAIKEWQLTHAEDEPFLDPIELQDPRVRMWREILRQRYNFNKRKHNEQ